MTTIRSTGSRAMFHGFLLLALAGCYSAHRFAGVSGDACEQNTDCHWPYECAGAVCRLPSAHAPLELADGSADTPTTGPHGEVVSDSQTGAFDMKPSAPPLAPPVSCDNKADAIDDSQCAAGMCAYSQCFFDADTYVIRRTDVAPKLGVAWESRWAYAAVGFINRRIIGDADPAAPDDVAGTFRMLWDDKYLYLHVEVNDATLSSDSSSAMQSPYPSYDDDMVEVYLDAGIGTRFARLPLLGTGITNPTYNQFAFGWQVSSPANYTQYRTQNTSVRTLKIDNADTYVVSAQISWTSVYGVDPAVQPIAKEGVVFGLDVHVNDDDGMGDVEITADGATHRRRQRKWTWFAAQDLAAHHPRAVGRAVLAASR